MTSLAEKMLVTLSGEQAMEAFEALAMRLFCNDRPGDTIASIDEWVDGLPEDEAAAFNAMLGQSFGRRPLHWEADHPISKLVAAKANA